MFENILSMHSKNACQVDKENLLFTLLQVVEHMTYVYTLQKTGIYVQQC